MLLSPVCFLFPCLPRGAAQRLFTAVEAKYEFH